MEDCSAQLQSTQGCPLRAYIWTMGPHGCFRKGTLLEGVQAPAVCCAGQPCSSHTTCGTVVKMLVDWQRAVQILDVGVVLHGVPVATQQEFGRHQTLNADGAACVDAGSRDADLRAKAVPATSPSDTWGCAASVLGWTHIEKGRVILRQAHVLLRMQTIAALRSALVYRQGGE